MGWFWQERSTASTTKPTSSSASSTTSTSDTSTSTPPTATTTTTTPAYLRPETLLSTFLLTTTLLLLRTIYTTHLRRIPTNAHIPPSLLPSSTASTSTTTTRSRTLTTYLPFLHRSSLFGHTSPLLIADPDNFRLYHTPLGRFALWSSTLRPIPTTRALLKNQTLSIRLAGIDAPELAHFGKPAQPHADEALRYLQYLLAERGKGRVRVWPLRRDQYERVVGVAFVRRRVMTFGEDGVVRRLIGGGGKKSVLGPVWHVNVGLEMVRKGWATVYEGKIGVEFGGVGMEKVYREAERVAKEERLGIWQDLKESKLEKVEKVLGRRVWDVLLPWRWGAKEKEKKKVGATPTATATTKGVVETPRQYKLRMKGNS